MSDEQPYIPTADELKAASQIDPVALQRWFTFSADAQIVLVASRADMDRLFLGLRQVTFAQGEALEALAHYVAGDKSAGDQSNAKAIGYHAQALANLTLFTSGIMAKATVDG